MAIKPSYRIPYGLNESYGDLSISLQTKDGSVGKVLPIKVILTYVLSFLVCLYLVMNTFIGTMANVPQKILFILLWTALTILLAKYDATRRMNAQLVPVVLHYLPKKARYIYTRASQPATPLFRIVGIEQIAPDGTIYFVDGTFGRWYRVVGSASILVFEADKEAIVTRVDNFFRKWNYDSEIVFMTTYEAQKVETQLGSLRYRFNNLRIYDKDLQDLAEEQCRVLKDDIGSNYKSLHQYMLIKAENREALTASQNILQSEINNSTLMIKQCIPLIEEDDIVAMYQEIYRGEGH
jgi:hypothetical protein